MAGIVAERKEEYSKNLAIQRVAWLSHIRCHGVLLWNDVTVDWSSLCTWFGICNAPGTRMWARGLLYPLFVAQTTWFGVPKVCSTKGEWVEHGIESHEVCGSNNVQVGFRLGEAPMGHMKSLLSKGGSLMRGVLGWVRAGLGGVWRLKVLRQSWDLRQVLQLEWVIVGGERDVVIFEAHFVDCGLFRLNPGAWGEHLTSLFSWVTVWLLSNVYCPVYLDNGSVLVYLLLLKWMLHGCEPSLA